MLRKESLIKFITFKLTHLQTYIKTLGKIRFFDQNIVSEDFFAGLLNAVYDYSLVNLNHTDLNAVAIDLGDETNRIAVQVTSERSKAKVQKTVDKFVEYGLVKYYDRLIVLIIGDRTGDYETLTVSDEMTFSGKDDVIDIADLIKKINQLDVGKLKSIAEYLDKELITESARYQTEGINQQGLIQINETHSELFKQSKDISFIIKMIQKTPSVLPSSMQYDVASSAHESNLDMARDFLKENKPSQALTLLEKQRTNIWSTANDPTKARLLYTIGCAKYATGNYEDAAHFFLQAEQYDPEDEKVLCNVAVAHLLLGERAKALVTSQIVLDRNSANFRARSVLIQSSDESLETIIDEIPKFARTNSEVAMAVGDMARRKGNMKQAKEWFEIAFENDIDDYPEIKGMLAELIFSGIVDDPSSTVRIGQADEQCRLELERALSLFEGAIKTLEDDDALRSRITWLLSAAIASRILGRQSESDGHLFRANRLSPENPAVIFQSAVAAQERGDYELAIELATKLKETDEIPHAPLFIAQLLCQENRFEDAISELQEFLSSDPNNNDVKTAKQILVDIYLDKRCVIDEKEPLDEAFRLCNEMIAANPDDVGNLVIESQVLRAMEETVKADASLEKALYAVEETTPSHQLILLGNELGVVKRWSDAVDIMGKIVDTTTNSLLTRQYLEACSQDGNFDKALEVCRRFRETEGSLEFITEMEIEILEKTGDLPNAQLVCEGFVKDFPEDGNIKTRLAYIYCRQLDNESLDEILSNPPDRLSLSIVSCQQLAQMYLVRKRYREAIELLYELRRTFSEGKVHLQYLLTFLSLGEERHEWLEFEEVVSDTSVSVEDSSGEIRWYTIEDREDASNDELPLSHPLAQKLVGKKKGDSVVLNESSMSSKQGTITEIVSKYVHAFQESGKIFETRFPELSGSFISVNLPKGEAGAKELIRKILNQEKNRLKQFQLVEDTYLTKGLTIGALAPLLGCNVIQVWEHLAENQDSRIISSSGVQNELVKEIELLNNESIIFVIDPISLMTIHALGLEDEIVQTVGRMGIAQATFDLLTETLHTQTAINRKGFIRLTKKGDSLVCREITEAQMTSNLISLKTLLNWIKTKCEILPWSSTVKISREQHQKNSKLIGSESLNTILVASEEGRVLLSDDLRLRQFARTEFGVEGVATQSILIHAVNKRVITKDRYHHAIIQLATAGYLYTRIDAHSLLEAAKQTQWKMSPPFSNMLWLLDGKYCDEDSAVRVVSSFLRLAWNESILLQSKDYLVIPLLNVLATGRNPFRVSDKLIIALSQQFLFMPKEEESLLRMIEAWRRTKIG